MTRAIYLTMLAMAAIACGRPDSKDNGNKLSIEGTWQLVSATSERNDTVVRTDPPGTKMIKIINADHFAFLNHNVKSSGDTTKTAELFVAGGGSYKLEGNNYIEHLEYCTARAYEGNTFEFTVEIKGDTLVQSGVEKLKDLGLGEENVQLRETYVRVKN